MAELEFYKRKLFQGLEPTEYQALVDYARDFQTGGIDRLNVNRGVTTEDVLRATAPLSQPVGPDLTSSVAQFNQFLANILGAKSQRIAGEEEKLAEANAAAVSAVTQALQPEEEGDYFIVVDGRLVDKRLIGSEDNPEGIVVKAKADKESVKNIPIDIFNQLDEDEQNRILGIVDTEQTVKGIPRDMFDGLSKTEQNQVLGLGAGESFVESFETKDGKFGYLYKDSTGTLKTNVLEDIDVAGDDLDTKDRIITLRQKKVNDPDNFTSDDQIELDTLVQLSKQPKPYESSAEKKWGEVSTDLIMSGPKKEDALFKVNQISQKFAEDINTGILTPKATILQEVLAPFGIDLKGVLDTFNINILNEASDSATIDAIATQFGIKASEDLAGQISERELIALFNTTFRLGAPEDFNREFAKGLNYLLRKDLAASTIAAREDINSAKEWAVAMGEWMQENPAPSMFADVYDYESLSDLNLDLNLRDPRNDGEN
jgi:hypothetical protein